MNKSESKYFNTAAVNRSTFYLHYENTGDLQDLEFINEKYLYPYLSFIKENQRVFCAVLSQPAAFDSKAIFQRLFDNIFKPILDRFHYPKDAQNYVMMFYLNGITAIITEWLKDGCQKSIEDISAIIHDCVYGRG